VAGAVVTSSPQFDGIDGGGAGNDSLFGSISNDILDGGTGNDNLFDNAGDDIYNFHRGNGNDIIHDFVL
jgi:Ca2+-binding RTX toxin-like protein